MDKLKYEIDPIVSDLVIKYGVNFNKLTKPNKLSIDEMNLFYGILGVMKNTGTREVVLSYDYVKALANRNPQERPTRTSDFLRKFTREIGSFTFETKEVIDEFNIESGAVIPLFSILKYSAKDRKLRIQMNQNEVAQSLLNELTKKFISFDFESFAKLQTRQAKALYRKLAEFKDTGFYVEGSEAIVSELGIPESQASRAFSKYIKPAVESISELFPDMNIQTEPLYNGRDLVSVKFSFPKNVIGIGNKDLVVIDNKKSNSRKIDDDQPTEEEIEAFLRERY